MEAYTDTEIAQQLICSRTTVHRRLEVIRRQLQRSEAIGNGFRLYPAARGQVDTGRNYSAVASLTGLDSIRLTWY